MSELPFITWARKELSENYDKLIGEAVGEALSYLQNPKDTVIKEVLEKMAREPREPSPSVDVQAELHDEHKDLLGWVLVKHYLNEKANKN